MDELNFDGLIAVFVFLPALVIGSIAALVNFFILFYRAYAREQSFYQQRAFGRLMGNLVFISFIYYFASYFNENKQTLDSWLDTYCLPIVLAAIILAYLVRRFVHRHICLPIAH